MSTELPPDRKAEPAFPPASSALVGLFSRSGEYWTLGLGAARFPIKDLKGLGYIQRLLQHPGKEFHALDLLIIGEGGAIQSDTIVGREETLPVGIAIRRGLSGDTGEALDAQAKQDYQRRRRELIPMLEDQRERGNHERADQIEEELESLNREIERAVGLGGRARRTGSNAERARLSVTRAIKTALEKVSEQHEDLAKFLDGSIRTGSFCSYAPDSERPVVWQFSLEDAKPPPTIQTETVFVGGGGEHQNLRSQRTPFVGRETERATLRGLLEQARAGRGRVVMISGSPGVGKTRIATELATEASSCGFLTLQGGCSEREDSVPFIPLVEILEDALARAPSPEAFHRALGDSAAEVARLVPQLRRMFPDLSAPTDLTPEQTRRVLFNSVWDLLVRASRNSAVLLVLDDLHWADDGTLSLLAYLAKRVETFPVLIVGTYRDSEFDPALPLARTLDKLLRLHLVERLALVGLPQDSVAEMLRELASREPPEFLVKLIYGETEGNPYFIEELFRYLVEKNRLIDAEGRFRDDLKLSDVDVPESVQIVIGRRLARLATGTQKVLSVAAIVGRSFTFDLLEASTRVDPDGLLDFLEEAERAGLISSTLQYPDVRFRFSHEITRQAVIRRLSIARRQALHLEIAGSIERLHAHELEDYSNDLAYHLVQAGRLADPSKTIRYLAIAGEQCMARSANGEAVSLLSKALDLLKSLPLTLERSKSELGLQMSLGTALMATRGFASPEVQSAYDRARILAGELDKTPRTAAILMGLWTFSLVRGMHRKARDLAEQALAIALSDRASTLEVQRAHMMVGVSSINQGDLICARTHLEECCAKALPQHEHVRRIAEDPQIVGRGWLAVALARLGYLDQALATTLLNVRLAQESGQVRNVAIALNYLASVHVERREWAEVLQQGEVLMKLSEAQGLPQWLAAGKIYKGTGTAYQSSLKDGAEILHRALQEWRATGAVTPVASYLGRLASIYGAQGHYLDAMPLIDEAISLAQECGERFAYPELFEWKGELLLKSPLEDPSARRADAEKVLLQGLEVAHNDQVRLIELRIALALTRLWQEQDKKSQAQRLLSSRYDWFTEGFDTVDLREARSVLFELSQAMD